MQVATATGLHPLPPAALPPPPPPLSRACCSLPAGQAPGTKQAWATRLCGITLAMTSSAGLCGTLAALPAVKMWTMSSPRQAALVRRGQHIAKQL